MISHRFSLAAACLALAAWGLAGCGTNESVKPEKNPPKVNLNPLGGSTSTAAGSAPQVGVNSFLWRATLDTLTFMPLASADPFGGVVITDWYAPPESPSERFKVTVYILDRRLRADAVKVAVFRQVRQEGSADWTSAPVNPQTGVTLENAILTRARQLRIASSG